MTMRYYGMVVASNSPVQNANNMSLAKENNNNSGGGNNQNNNNNNNNINNDNDSNEVKGLSSSLIKAISEPRDNAEATDSKNFFQASNVKAVPCGMLVCRENSHHFQDRVLVLDKPVKIGRTVARVKASPTNAIFDCKVLSRHHAILYFKDGKFYLQDTKSSNGTFVNNQRLSATNEQSTPREVCSGDIVQFGVNVVENTKNVQHGCIVATLRLYLPDGSEAKASNVVSCPQTVSLEDLYKLKQYLQDAAKREKLLRYKLSMLEKLVYSAQKAADESWTSYIDEDKLLSRIETIEGQLVAYSKNFNNDKVREELARLQDEKGQYQKAAKDSLRKVLKEKLELSLQFEILRSRFDEAEQETQNLRQIMKKNQLELQEFAAKYSEAQRRITELTNELADSTDAMRELVERSEVERNFLLRRLVMKMSNELNLRNYVRNVRLDGSFVLKQITALKGYVPEDDKTALELVVSTLNKLNSMLELQDKLTEDNKEEEELKEYKEDALSRLKKKNKIEVALNVEINQLLTRYLNYQKGSKNEELGEDNGPQSNGLVEKIDSEDAAKWSLDSNVSNTEKKFFDEDKDQNSMEKTENDAREKPDRNAEKSDDKSIEGVENNIMDNEFLQRHLAEKIEDESREKFDDISTDGADSDVTEIDNERDLDADLDENVEGIFEAFHKVLEKSRQQVEDKARLEDAAQMELHDNNQEDINLVLEEFDKVIEESEAEVSMTQYVTEFLSPLPTESRELLEPDVAESESNLQTESRELLERDVTESVSSSQMVSKELLEPDVAESVPSLQIESKELSEPDVAESVSNLQPESEELLEPDVAKSVPSLQSESKELLEPDVAESVSKLQPESKVLLEPDVAKSVPSLQIESKELLEPDVAEVVALRERCRALEKQEALLIEKYAKLENQCGDLLDATYTVPIHYVVPLVLVLLFLLLEKIF